MQSVDADHIAFYLTTSILTYSLHIGDGTLPCYQYLAVLDCPSSAAAVTIVLVCLFVHHPCCICGRQDIDLLLFGDSLFESFLGTTVGHRVDRAADIPFVWTNYHKDSNKVVMAIAGKLACFSTLACTVPFPLCSPSTSPYLHHYFLSFCFSPFSCYQILLSGSGT